ncbi:MAG: YbaN family protein [Anaerolineae bacterium]|jgi:uncharacterized membrane protein YbaN (DUF454 family)|nr:YbaN family protein [Anaerolineae bacterium]
MDSQQHQLPKTVRVLLLTAGSLSLLVGVIGVFVPVLPTTPFLLISAACYARGSERFYNWLLNHPWFGEYIRNYREGKGIERRHKVAALVLLWTTIIASAVFFITAWWMRAILLLIAVSVTLHLHALPVYHQPKPRQ